MSASISTEVPPGMVGLAGGTFTMGSDRFYSEEAPTRRVSVDPFWMDETPVTNAQFRTFVETTGYVTLAEIPPDPKYYPGIRPEMVQPASAVFEATSAPVNFANPSWWSFRAGANWSHPLGTGSSIDGIEDHPVVHVSHVDAETYAAWAGKALPSEAEWEFAARGGLDGCDYAWGEVLQPQGRILANYWQGTFPYYKDLSDGWERTSPVRGFPANGYGLYDMIGNVWEWTADWFTQPKTANKRAGSCCVVPNPRGGTRGGSIDKHDRARIPRKVMKGGSHLCAENYCQRYRPAARYAQPVDTSTSHVGFRCVIRP